MPKKIASRDYEFQCPQFVDFCSGIEGTPSDDGSFGSAFPDKRSEMFLKSRCLIRKLDPHSTPFNKQFFVNTSCRSNNTDSEKIKRIAKKIFKRQSRSVDSLHHLPGEKEQEFFPVNCRKRSVSATGDRLKKLTRPITPECLKRSRYISKKVIKTTEELELEKIALLQKQTSTRLRANEVAMRRLKMKQAYNIQTDSLRKEMEEKRKADNIPIGLGSFMEKINVYTRNVCSRPPEEIVKGQCPLFNSELKRANHSNKISRFVGSQSNMLGPNNACLTSVNEDGAESTDISHCANKNAENIQSVNSLLPPLKSRRCLFRENRQTTI